MNIFSAIAHPVLRFLLILVIVANGLSVQAQSPAFKTITLGKAKQATKVLALASDQNNHLYIATSESLLYYNGMTYEKIPLIDSLKSIISVLTMIGDELWIGTAAGHIMVHSNQGTALFTHADYVPQAKVTAIKALGDDQIGFSTYGDGAYLLRSDQSLVHINETNGLDDSYTYDILYHRETIWIATDAGVAQFDANGTAIASLKMKDGLPDNIVVSLLALDDVSIAIGMYDRGVVFYNTEKKTIANALNSAEAWNKGPVQAMLYDKEHTLWVATKNEGVVAISHDVAGPVQKSFTEINGLSSNKISCLISDKENNIWIGTQNGITFYTGSTFEFITNNEGLDNEMIFDVLKDKSGNLWVSNETGVHAFSYSEQGEIIITTMVNYADEKLQQVACLFEDATGNIWMGSYGSGLLQFDQKTKQIERFTAKDGLLNENILDIAQDAKGRLWLATLGSGLVSVEKGAKGPVFGHLIETESAISNYIYALHMDDAQLLWMGTDGTGVQVFDCNTDQIKPIAIPGMESKTVYSVAAGAHRSIWFSVADEGVYHLNQGKLTHYSEENGLRSNAVFDVVSIGGDQVFVIHDLGIDHFLHDEGVFVPYTVEKVNFTFTPNLNSTYVADQTIYIGTEQGLVQFSPFIDATTNSAPIVTLEHLKVMFQEVEIHQNMEFAYDQNHVVIEYLGTWMKKPESVVYAYMLEGFDKTWSIETKNLMATYSNLPPGEYTFKVRAKSDLGVWSDESQAVLSFRISKPFWQQWWFYLVVVVFAISTVAGYIQYRTKKLMADKQALENEVEKRTLEIRQQKDIIEHKNEEILSSITYAKRIQTAILPPERIVKEYLHDNFILYKPKDVVAGDFYWMESYAHASNPNGAKNMVLFAAADCTGHGVPGAMVSVICNNSLNRAVREFGLRTPGEILDKTRELVIQEFEKSEEEVKDGMDISLCALNTTTNELQWAGANNPLWIVRKGAAEMEEIKPDKQPIGKYGETKPFTTHRVQLFPGDTLYVFTDGYPDQFGGENGKKYKSVKFKQTLIHLSAVPMQEQKHLLDQEFEAWRGNLEQVDDVCVIGVRI